MLSIKLIYKYYTYMYILSVSSIYMHVYIHTHILEGLTRVVASKNYQLNTGCRAEKLPNEHDSFSQFTYGSITTISIVFYLSKCIRLYYQVSTVFKCFINTFRSMIQQYCLNSSTTICDPARSPTYILIFPRLYMIQRAPQRTY